MLRAAAAGLYQVYWSEEILDEATRNLVARGITTEAQATRLRTAMAAAFPEALVTGYEPLVGGMRNQEKDRHVAAAAVRAGAQVVVTANIKDFDNLPEGLEAQTPDDFLCNLLDLDPEMMVEIVRSQAADLRKPPRSFEDVVVALERIVPSFAESLRRAATSKGAG